MGCLRGIKPFSLRTVLEGGLAVVVSPSLRQSGFLFRKLARHLVASERRLPARDHDRCRAGLGRVSGVAAWRSSRVCYAACRCATRALRS